MRATRRGMSMVIIKTERATKRANRFLIPTMILRLTISLIFALGILRKNPKFRGGGRLNSNAPAMIVFCAFEQMAMVIEEGKKHGLMKSYPLVFIKNFSAQVLKANMKIVGATEYAVVLYRDRLPKFNNNGKMVFNWFEWRRDGSDVPKVHPTQKPIKVLKRLIEIFTDEGDVVIDPVAGSGSTLRACAELNRSCYGFEIKKNFYKDAKEKMLKNIVVQTDFFKELGVESEERNEN